MNKVILIGNLGKDPAMRYTQGDKPVASNSLATSFGKDAQKQTEWHNIVAWEKSAELLAACPKGSRVYVEGYLHTRKYDDKQGVTKYITEVIVNSIHLAVWPQAQTQVAQGDDIPPPQATMSEGGMTEDQVPF